MQEPADAYCISVMRPSTVIHARYLCGKLRAKLPKSRIVVSMWGAAEEITEMKERLRASGADELVSTLPDALTLFARIAASRAAVEPPTLELPPLLAKPAEVA